MIDKHFSVCVHCQRTFDVLDRVKALANEAPPRGQSVVWTMEFYEHQLSRIRTLFRHKYCAVCDPIPALKPPRTHEHFVP